MIDEPPLLTIRRRPDAPAAGLLQPFLEAPTGWLIDAMAGRGAMDAAIKPLAAEVPAMRRFVGVALTCWCGPNDNLALLAAVALAEPGDVIVAASEGFSGAGMAGDLVAGMARNRGCAAIVTDGMVRDRDGIVAVGLPVFCRGVTPNSCVRSGPGTVGLPITAGGVPVATGDLILGDADGVVVVPQARLAEVGARLAAVRAAEQAAEAKVRGRGHHHAGNQRAPGLRSSPLGRLEPVGPDRGTAPQALQLVAAAAAGDFVEDRRPSRDTGGSAPRRSSRCRTSPGRSRSSPGRARHRGGPAPSSNAGGRPR